MNEPTKICKRCEQEKPLSSFHKCNDKWHMDGRENICALCRNERRKNGSTPIPNGMKLCRGCDSLKPATEKYFYRSSSSKSGLGLPCKECDAKRKGRVYSGPLPNQRHGYRICAECKRELPATSEYFHRDKTSASGFKYLCKGCMSKRRGYKNQAMVIPAVLPGFKYCTKCGSIHPATNEFFHNDRLRPDLLSPHCRQCVAKQGSRWRKKNRETIRRKEREPKSARIARVRKQRRRARKRQLPDDLRLRQWQRCLDYFDGCCAYCGRPDGLFHVIAMDHYIPLSDPNCPGTSATNIVPACHGDQGCNNSKHSRPPSEWLESKFGPRRAKQILARIEAYFTWVREQDGA